MYVFSALFCVYIIALFFSLQDILVSQPKAHFILLTNFFTLGYPMSQDVVFDDGPRVVFLSGNLKSLLDSVRYYSSYS